MRSLVLFVFIYELRKAVMKIQLQTLFRKFLRGNIVASRWFDNVFMPEYFIIQGNQAFQDNVAAPYIMQKDIVIYDMGGGSRPYVSPEMKIKNNQTIIGLDIDKDELESAPQGSYDKIITADLTQYVGAGDADLIICQAALEHVPDNEGSFCAIASTLKSGGVACIFTPSRNAIFARLNMMLPQSIKQKILFAVFPHKAKGHDGFKAYYDQCTPREFRELAEENKMDVIQLEPYFKSSYFEICFPLYIIWRLWIIGFKIIAGENAAETFSIVLKKR